ncbi:hypothetical protein Glove_139g245 [Diversispora epigaea]|uniref:Protein kinase domain-containing protein n=1 Tax=Diversispora epigaea TaxID=1348612 RepID=A0A397J4K9_9GLOM|nr:hypothetical protein Glove_139g245 [Diversispora epigaea]
MWGLRSKEGYIAPEVLLDGKEYTKAADVYSLAIIAGFQPYSDVPHDEELALKEAEELSANETTTDIATATTPLNYKTHPQTIYV